MAIIIPIFGSLFSTLLFVGQKLLPRNNVSEQSNPIICGWQWLAAADANYIKLSYTQKR